MNKTEKMRGCVALCGVALSNLRELRETLLNELSCLYKALGIEDQDSEKIEDVQLYKIAGDLEWNAERLQSASEDLASVLEDLEKIKI